MSATPLVVDADSHVMEPADLWLRYIDPPFRDRAIRIEEAHGVEQLVIAEHVVLAGVLAGLGGANLDRRAIFAGGLRYADGCPPASHDPAARVAMLDAEGIRAGVVFPTIGILPVPTDDDALVSAYCRAYNRWQADFAAAAPGRVVPIATVNLRDRDAALAELDWCLARGFRGLFVPPEPVGGRRPGHPHFDPLWARCAEAGVPLCLHVVVRFAPPGLPWEPWFQTGGFAGGGNVGPIFSFGLGAIGQLMPALASMITDGLFDRLPALKVVAVESGCGWAAYLMDKLDAKHEVLGPLAPRPLRMKPSDYVRRNCWFVADPDEPCWSSSGRTASSGAPTTRTSTRRWTRPRASAAPSPG
jgi:predicted TIM-barrel fold metal-dependent hydrolase